MKTARTTNIPVWAVATQGPLVRFLVMSALLLACAWSAAFAQQRDIVVPRTEQRVALVIGNGGYKHTAPLANPPNDAQLMAETLTSLGFRMVGGAGRPPEQIARPRDGCPAATRSHWQFCVTGL